MERAPLLAEGTETERIRDDAPKRGVIVGLAGSREVFVNGVPLLHAESARLLPHLAGGFAWGHIGRGPKQLALAILLRFVDEKTALRLYEGFEREVVSAAIDSRRPFSLVIGRIRAWLGSKGVRV